MMNNSINPISPFLTPYLIPTTYSEYIYSVEHRYAVHMDGPKGYSMFLNICLSYNTQRKGQGQHPQRKKMAIKMKENLNARRIN